MQRPFDAISFLTAALAEDIGTGDVTAMATIPADAQAAFTLRARQDMVVAGLIYLEPLFALMSPQMEITLAARDGDRVGAGTTLATLNGPARALLAGERTALNLLQQLSGVATLTRAYVDAVEGTGAQILDTRKTIPGLRHLQKYAVRCGGGVNHRMGLFDAVLIKDNHIAVAGGVSAAVEAAREYVYSLPHRGRAGVGPSGAEPLPYSVPLLPSPLQGEACLAAAGDQEFTIQVECDTLAQVAEAIAAGATMLLLDNMDNDALRAAVALAKPHGLMTEASGNVNLQTVRGIAETGVDRISIGRLTHSAPAVDIGLDAI